MPSEPERNLCEYAVVRYVPSVERGEYVNVGLVMMCKRRRWLQCRFHLDEKRILALFPASDLGQLERQLSSFGRIAHGDRSPIGVLEAHERFRWLTAVRSASISTSRPHPALCNDPEETFEKLFNVLIL